MRNALKFWKSILWAAVIAFLLFYPGDKLPGKKLLDIPYYDKIIHAVLFLLLEFLLLLDAKSLTNPRITKLNITLLSIVYALLTEWLQYLFAVLRHGDWLDFLADVFGILIGWIVFIMYSKIIIRISPRN